MFVVRVVVDEAGDTPPDHKAFVHLEDAMQRYRAGLRQTLNGEFDVIAVYEVAGVDDPRVARDAVIAGIGQSEHDVRLIEITESVRRTVSRIDLDLGSLASLVATHTKSSH